MGEHTFTESFKVKGSQLLDKFKNLIHEGNVRRVIIKQDDRSIAEFPLTVGVIGAVFAPVLAAVGALAALLNECTIEVERAVETSAHAPDADEKADRTVA
jgi:hypothetical protein